MLGIVYGCIATHLIKKAGYSCHLYAAESDGERRGGMAAHMKIAADVLTEEQMKAVALYLESLREE